MNTKYIYFGPASADDIMISGTEGYFELDGTYYSFQLEVNLDDGFCRLQDSVGRMVPLDKEHYRDLVAAFDMVITTTEELSDIDEALETLGAFRRSVQDDISNVGFIS